MAESSDRERDGGDPVVEISPNKRYIRFNKIVAQTINGIQSSYKAFDTKIGMEVEWHHINLNALQESEQSRVSQCVNYVKKIQNKYIIEYLACWFGKETRTLNIITTHLDTLQDFISKVKTLRWRIIKKWGKQILRGLDHLHQQKPEIIHRNVTSSHVYIDGGLGTLNIGDLWMATILVEDFDNPIGLSDAMLQQLALGSIAYIAPESFTEINLTTKVDIYSFGMCLLEMITREEPYSEHKSHNGVMHSTEVMTEKIKKKVLSNIPPRSLLRIRHPLAIAFIEECLKPVKYRLSASELLLHEFLIPTVDDDREIILDPKIENDDTELDVNDNNGIENESVTDVNGAIVVDFVDSLRESDLGKKFIDTSISSDKEIHHSNQTIVGEVLQQDGIESSGDMIRNNNTHVQHDNKLMGAMKNGKVMPKNINENHLSSSNSISLNNLKFCCLKDPEDLVESVEIREGAENNMKIRDESLRDEKVESGKNLMTADNKEKDLNVENDHRIKSSRSDKSEDSIVDTLGCLSNDASTLQSIEDNYEIDNDSMENTLNEKFQNVVIDIKAGYDPIISNSDRILLAMKERENRLGKVLEDFEQGENVELDRGVYDGRAEEDGGAEDIPLLSSKIDSSKDEKSSSANTNNDIERNPTSQQHDQENNSNHNSINKNKNDENVNSKIINDIQIIPNNNKENYVNEGKANDTLNPVHKSLKSVIAESQQQQHHQELQQVSQQENIKSPSNESIQLNIQSTSSKPSQFKSSIETLPRDLPPKERLDFRSMFIHTATEVGSNDSNDSKNKEIACSLIAIPVENTNELQLLIKIPAAFTTDFSTDKEVEFSFDSVKDDIEVIAEEMILELGLTFAVKELAEQISRLVYSVKVDNISNGSQVFIRRDSSINPSVISNFNSSIESTIIPIATVTPKRPSMLPFGSLSSIPLGVTNSEGEYPKGGEYSLGIITVKSISNSGNDHNADVSNNREETFHVNDNELEEKERKNIVSIILDELMVSMEVLIPKKENDCIRKINKDEIPPNMTSCVDTNTPTSELYGEGLIEDSKLLENNRKLISDNERIIALNQSNELCNIEAESVSNSMIHTENISYHTNEDEVAEKSQGDNIMQIESNSVMSGPLNASSNSAIDTSINPDISVKIPILNFITNMVNSVVDIGMGSHIDFVEYNAATTASHIDSAKGDVIDTNDIISNDKNEIKPVCENIDVDSFQLINDKDSKINEYDGQQSRENYLEFQISNGMESNISPSIISPPNIDVSNVDISGRSICVISTNNKNICDEIESIRSNSSDTENKHNDDSEIITNNSDNNNLTISKIGKSLSHSHTLITDDRLFIDKESQMDAESNSSHILDSNCNLTSSSVDATSDKETIIKCSDNTANSNIFPLSEKPCMEDLRSSGVEVAVKIEVPFINTLLKTPSALDSQTSFSLDRTTNMNIEGSPEKCTSNEAESEAEAQDELDMHKETEKMDRESKIARRAFEQRIQKHKLIQEKCEDDLLKVELEYEKKIAELNRKEESAITKKDVDLFHLNTEMENEIKDFKEQKKRTFQKLDLELKLDLDMPSTQTINAPAIIQRTFSPPPSPVSKISNSSIQVQLNNSSDCDGNNHNGNIINHNTHNNNRNNHNNNSNNSINMNSNSSSYNRGVVRINSPGIG